MISYTFFVLTELLQNQLFFYSIIFVSSVFSAALGTGMSFVLIPLAALQYGAKESVGIMTIYFLFQNINKIAVYRKHINWKIAIRVICWSLPGVIIGSLALNVIPVYIFKKILAAVILLYLANDIFKLIPKKHSPDKYLPGLSMFYGFLSGLIGSGNVIKGPLFTSLGLLKETYVGTYAVTSLFINIPKLITYSATGIIDMSAFAKSIPFLLIAIAGTFLGKYFIGKIHNDVFYIIITASFALSAIILLIE
jgi:uncharacterized membrane protein YfcA